MSATNTSAPRRGRRLYTGRALTLIAALAVSGTAACSGGDSGTGPAAPRDPVGIYGLMQIGGAKIPAEIFRGRYYDPQQDVTFDPLVIRVTGGEIILQENGAFHLAIDLSFEANGRAAPTTISADGTYEIRGTQIALATDAGVDMGTLRNGVIGIPVDVRGDGKMRQLSFRYAP